MDNNRRIMVERLNWHDPRCPICDSKLDMHPHKLEGKCPDCGVIVGKKKRYSKYPDMKHDEHGASVPAKYYRIMLSTKYLKPFKRITKAKGKEYIHYAVTTTVPSEWKNGVKVKIEPLPEGSSIEELRQNHRNLNEMGPRFRKQLKKYLEKQEKEDELTEKKYDRWLKGKLKTK